MAGETLTPANKYVVMNIKVFFPLLSISIVGASFCFPRAMSTPVTGIEEDTCTLVSGTALNHTALGSWLGLCVKDNNGEMIYSHTHDFYDYATDDGTFYGNYIGPDPFAYNIPADGTGHDIIIRGPYIYCSNTEAQSHPVYENCVSLNISRFFRVGEIIKISSGTKFPSTEYLKSRGAEGKVYTLESDSYLLFESLETCYFSVVEDKEFAKDKYNKIHYLWDYIAPNNYRDNERKEMKETAESYLQSLLASTSAEENTTIMINFEKAISAFKTDAELTEIEHQRELLLNDICSTLEINFDDYEVSVKNTLIKIVENVKHELESSFDLDYINRVINKLKVSLKSVTTKDNLSFETYKATYLALLEPLLGDNKVVNEIVNKAILEINEAITEGSVFGAYITAKNKLLNI